MNNYMPNLDNLEISGNIQLLRLNQGEAESLNRPITTSKIEAAIKNSRYTKALDHMASQENFTKHSKKN